MLYNDVMSSDRGGSPADSTRLAGVAGVAGILLPLAGLLVLPIWAFPATTSTGGELEQFFAVHRAHFQAVMVLNASGVSLWPVCAAGIGYRLRQANGSSVVPNTCFALATVSFTTLLLCGFVSGFLLGYGALAPGQTQLLYDLAFGCLAMSGLPTAVAMGSFALMNLRYRVFPPRSTWIATATAAAHLAILFSLIVPSGLFSLEGGVITIVPAFLFVWIFDTGLFMALQPHRKEAAGRGIRMQSTCGTRPDPPTVTC